MLPLSQILYFAHGARAPRAGSGGDARARGWRASGARVLTRPALELGAGKDEGDELASRRHELAHLFGPRGALRGQQRAEKGRVVHEVVRPGGRRQGEEVGLGDRPRMSWKARAAELRAGERRRALRYLHTLAVAARAR